jgi:hypothetical protein
MMETFQAVKSISFLGIEQHGSHFWRVNKEYVCIGHA